MEYIINNMNNNNDNVVNMNGTPNTAPKITLKETSEVTCDKCKKNIFAEGMFLRSVSPILTGQPKTSYIPVPLFYCVSCGAVNDEFVPMELRTNIIV
jgi:hypothetical protein